MTNELHPAAELREIYKSGSGAVRLRATTEMGPIKRGSRFIYVTSVPYTVNKAQLSARDACEVKGPLKLDFAAGAEGAHVLLYEMALSSDGRADAVLP